MPKSDNQRLKLFYILDYLTEHSGPSRPVSAAELTQMLEKRDIHCERRTIYNDIRLLQDYGADIELIMGRSGGYYLSSRFFQLPELKLLIDAVASSRYLTQKKSQELIAKLCSLSSCDEQRLLKRSIVVANRVKSLNETIYYNVDAIQEAITENRQITFQYFDWNIHAQRVYRQRDYTASPYGLVQDNENCYLLALSPRHGITSYRIDRMSRIQSLDTPREPCAALTGSALTEYVSHRFQMFGGERQQVKLRFARELCNVVIDRFGTDVMLIPDGEDAFVFTVDVAVSPLFLSWVIGFGSKAKILYPQSVIDQCSALCREVLSQYQPTEKD